MKNFDDDLLSLGYRKMNDVIWAKPFASSLFLFDTRSNRLSQNFIGADDKPHVWTSKLYEKQPDTDFKFFIKYFEKYHSTNLSGLGYRDMSFVTVDEQIAKML